MSKLRLRKVLASPVLGFVPWIAFSLLEGPGRCELAVGAALGIAVLELVLGKVVDFRPKLLDVAAIIFFAILLVVGLVIGHDGRALLERWAGEISNVMLVVIALGSIAFKMPFTIQYAREMTEEENWKTPLFLHINYVLTWVWTLSFAITAFADWYGDGPLHQPDNIWTNWLISIAFLIFAIRFTEWYPDIARARYLTEIGEGPEVPRSALANLLLPLTGYLVPLGIALLVFGGAPWWVAVGLIVAGSLLTSRLAQLERPEGTTATV